LIGESLGRSAELEPSKKPRVVVGWDDRPANNMLAGHLTVGLNIAEFEVIHIGLCATPTLHYATLFYDADFGCMITASHNPVEDSGLKIFSKYGYKTTPEFEQELSRNAISLSQEERELDSIDTEKLSQPSISHELAEWCQTHHPNWLSRRYQMLAELIQRDISEAPNIHQPLLIDSSKGTGSFWLADWLSSNGIHALEISHEATALNDNCGAGEFSPTQEWTFEEAKNSPHLLINQLPRRESGILVGAALDGDGDRCLLIETTQSGFKIIDGDRIADNLLNCVTHSGNDWTLAASIESDLSLTTNLNRFPTSVTVSETAVGDRWLSFKLSNNKINEFITNSSLPSVLGVEDSGHIVLASPHPNQSENWSLVGDGAMTLVAFLLATTKLELTSLMQRGWKQRQSVKGVDRSKWDGRNDLSDIVEKTLFQKLSNFSEVSQWHRTTIDGEPNLMLITCLFANTKLSIGVRNSGTQAKTSVSARLEHGGHNKGIQEAIDEACNLLAKHMISH
jgi:phosphomannomutase